MFSFSSSGQKGIPALFRRRFVVVVMVCFLCSCLFSIVSSLLHLTHIIVLSIPVIFIQFGLPSTRWLHSLYLCLLGLLYSNYRQIFDYVCCSVSVCVVKTVQFHQPVHMLKGLTALFYTLTFLFVQKISFLSYTFSFDF